MRCASCGFENPAGMKFCGQCGARLLEAIPASELVSEERPAEFTSMEAERRQLTVMFCDLVDSTKLSLQLDPEDFREVVRAYQEIAAKMVQRFEGHIAQYLGDGILVYFGYPFAHEDDAQRAVRAALGIAQGVQQLNAHLQQEKNVSLQLRVGIHTGMAVVGEMGGGEKREQLALGETPNLAARLQSAAAPDTIVVSAATHRLIQGFFVCEALGAQHLKGVDKAIGIYRVNQESSAMSRHDVVLKLTPFIGRQQELAELLAHWHRAREGAGQVVLLSGEAGIGKSRLRQEFAERIRGEPHAFIRCRCSPYHQSAAFYPVIDMLERQLKFAREDSSGQKLNKLTEMLAPYSLKQSEILPAFSRLLAIPFDDHDHAASPELQKQQTLQAVLSLLLAMAAKQPLCFVMDDLHWADSATLEMLSLLIPQVSPVRLFCLFSFRPAFQPPWGDHLHVRQITLAHLSRDETAQMIKKIVFDKTLPSAVLAQLVSKTDGVPLFVEELTKTVLELGLLEEQAGRYELTAPLPSVTIPATLYDSLMARLDRLAIAKEVAQIGATIGRDFDYEILRAVSPFDEISLQRELLRLVEAGLLYQKDAQYKFKHALIRDAAYDSLLKSKRRQYHQQIAQVLATRCREMTESHTALVAYHQAAVKINEPVIPGQ